MVMLCVLYACAQFLSLSADACDSRQAQVWWERLSGLLILASFIISCVSAEMRPPDNSRLADVFNIIDDIFTGGPRLWHPCRLQLGLVLWHICDNLLRLHRPEQASLLSSFW